MNILIVDQDLSTRNQLLAWLGEWDHQATAAEDEAHAQKLLGDSAFDIVLAHWSSASPEFFQNIRKNPKYLYVIVYTPEITQVSFKSCSDAGADDVLGTPLDPVHLCIRILAAKRMLEVHRSFAEQSSAHRALNEKLDLAYQTLQSELHSASALQLSLLPTVSDVHPKFCLDWLVLPSSYLAGDNLNYFMMQKRYLIFYQLDVAGHGVPSALLSVTLNQLLSPQPGSPMVRFDPKLELKRIVPPVEVVSELNRRFQPQGDGYFTMIYAVLDTKTGEIRLCQAGHPSPIKLATDGTISMIGDGGFPVGLWPDMTYEETRATLLPGERLVLYSDGVLACLNGSNISYTVEQLQDVIRRNASVPVKQVLQAVKEDLENWCEGRDFPDDISLLIVESKP